MKWNKTKQPIGDEAFIVIADELGNIYGERACRCFTDGLNELFKHPFSNINIIEAFSPIKENVGLWIDGDKWYPIFNIDRSSVYYAVMEDYEIDNIIKYFIDGDEKDYIIEQYHRCCSLLDYFRNEILGGDGDGI